MLVGIEDEGVGVGVVVFKANALGVGLHNCNIGCEKHEDISNMISAI